MLRKALWQGRSLMALRIHTSIVYTYLTLCPMGDEAAILKIQFSNLLHRMATYARTRCAISRRWTILTRNRHGPNDGLLSSGNKPLVEPMLTRIQDLWQHRPHIIKCVHSFVQCCFLVCKNNSGCICYSCLSILQLHCTANTENAWCLGASQVNQ